VSQEKFKFSHAQSIALVLGCTLLGAVAQYFIKASGMHPTAPGLDGLLHNWRLWCGLCLYGMSTVLMVLALRDGELSLLYPVISLTYVWVSILSVFAFGEHMTPLKIAGISTICAGVALLGKAPERKS